VAEPSKLVEDLKRRYEALKSDPERVHVEAHCEEIAEVMDPAGRGFVGHITPGTKRMQKVYDNTGIHSADLLTAGLHGTATNPATKWHRLSTAYPNANENQGVRAWLEESTDVLFTRRYAPGSKFTSALNEVFDSAGRYGTGILYVTTRRNGRNLYESRALSECVLAENDEGDIDTLMRCFTWTARQCLQEWGDNVSDKVKEAVRDNKGDTRIDIVHAVYPRNDRDPTKKGAKDMAWASIYFERQTAHKLEESGYPDFPFAVFRWGKRPGEVYGRGPGSVALPDVKMLQAAQLTTIKAAQKITDPPLFLPDDGFMGPIRTVPGGLNFYRGNREIFPMPTSDKLPITFEWMEELRNRIRQTFYTDILQFVTDKDMTATEVQQRTAERMRLLGPVLGRLEEFLGKVIELETAIAKRAGQMPPLPPELANDGGLIPPDVDIDIQVEYVGPIFQAQRAADANGFAQLMQYVAPLIEADGGSSFAEVYPPQKVIKHLGRMFYVPADMEATEDEQKQMQQAKAAAMSAQTAVPMADAAQKGAGAVKQLADAQASGGVDLAPVLEQMVAQGGMQ
jgi:hypothetical protein